MTFRFNTDDLVVNMLPGDTMTVGRVYRVVNSYDGHSGCGAQEWCRVADDRGVVSGYDPDRFVPYTTGVAQTSLATALRLHRRLKKMLSGIKKDSVFGDLHSKLTDMLEDAESMVVACAQPVDDQQIILNEVKGHDRDGSLYEVRVGAKPVWYFFSRRRPDEGGATYHVFFGEHTLPLKSTQFDVAFAEVKYMLEKQAEGRSHENWAAYQTLPTLSDVQAPAAS